MGGDRTTKDSAADIARRIQRMTLLVRGEARSLMHLRPVGQPVAPQSGPGPVLPQGAPAARTGGKRPSPYTGKQCGKPGLDVEPKTGEWWVLAQGRALDPDDFDAREAARADLLEAVLRAGVLVPENIWVWDETGRAQLVLATLPTEERAHRVAERLREKGLAVIVRREMP
ncbi:MAG: hypothetical protein AB7E46_03825 [Desulfovibrio sp.]